MMNNLAKAMGLPEKSFSKKRLWAGGYFAVALWLLHTLLLLSVTQISCGPDFFIDKNGLRWIVASLSALLCACALNLTFFAWRAHRELSMQPQSDQRFPQYKKMDKWGIALGLAATLAIGFQGTLDVWLNHCQTGTV